jgi:ribonuclease HI
MSEVWPLPSHDEVMHTGKEWLLQLLIKIPEEQRVPTLLTFWRIWHAHNEMTHDKPCPPIEGSRRFLVSYLKTLMLIKQFPNADMVKGKMVLDEHQGFKRVQRQRDGRAPQKQSWRPPDRGEAKLNTDGAYTGAGAGAGMVLRDHQGEVIFTACRNLEYCRDATEAELVAIEEGLKLSLHWTDLRLVIETDSAEAIALINDSTPNTSVHAFRINEIREFLRERESRFIKVSRDLNVVAHELARISRTQGKTDFWLACFPQEVAGAVFTDCNPAVA